MTRPRLIEPGVKYFLGETLLQCKKTRFEFTSRMINIGMLIVFVIVISGWLYYNYNEKKRKQDEKENEKNQQYILGLVQKYQMETKAKQKAQYKNNEMITELPEFENVFYQVMRENIDPLNPTLSTEQQGGQSEVMNSMKHFL